MRIRTIKPDFYLDEELARRPPLERLLFSALWLQADRDGKLEDRPSKIKAQALPYDDCDCDEMLGNLAATGYIIRYEVRGRKYIQVRTFGKHQRPNTREPKSTIPDPPRKLERARARTREYVHAQAEGEGEGNGEGEGKGNARKRPEFDRLMAEPEIRALSELWVQELGAKGDKVNLGIARAVQRFFTALYTYPIGADAIMGIKTARDPATRDRYPARCLARWAAEHNDKPGFVLRPEKVEEIAADYRKYAMTPIPEPPPRPRALDRDDQPMTAEQLAAIREKHA